MVLPHKYKDDLPFLSILSPNNTIFKNFKFYNVFFFKFNFFTFNYLPNQQKLQ